MNVQPGSPLAPVYSLPARRGGDPYSVANGRDERRELVCWVATRVRVGRLQGMMPSPPLRDGYNKNGIGPPFTSTRCPTRGWGSSGIPALQAIQCRLCLLSILRSFGVQIDFFLATCQPFFGVLPLAPSEVTIYEVAFENAGSRCEEYCSPNRYQRRTV